MLPRVRLADFILESCHDRIRSSSRDGLHVEVLQGLIGSDEHAVIAVPKDILPDVDGTPLFFGDKADNKYHITHLTEQNTGAASTRRGPTW